MKTVKKSGAYREQDIYIYIYVCMRKVAEESESEREFRDV